MERAGKLKHRTTTSEPEHDAFNSREVPSVSSVFGWKHEHRSLVDWSLVNWENNVSYEKDLISSRLVLFYDCFAVVLKIYVCRFDNLLALC